MYIHALSQIAADQIISKAGEVIEYYSPEIKGKFYYIKDGNPEDYKNIPSAILRQFLPNIKFRMREIRELK